MVLRIVKVDELQFLTSLKAGIWGSHSARFAKWTPGDLLAFQVDTGLAALAGVAGKPFVSKEPVWSNGAFPHRIKLTFDHALLPENRPPVLGPVRDALMEAWGPKYGWGIRNQQALSGKGAEVIAAAITARPNDLATLQKNLDEYLQQAQLKAGAAKAKTAIKPKPLEDTHVAEPPTEDTGQSDEEPLHAYAQHLLIEIGKITGCSVWIATNDRKRLYKGKALGDGCVTALPNLGLNQDATARIGLIDIIWLRQNVPLCAFEVEVTTSIYSGLLRMSDLLAVVPAINMKLYLVVAEERLQKAASELARPTFRKIGLSDFCRIVTIESLTGLLAKVQGLHGHVQPSILDTIALPLDV